MTFQFSEKRSHDQDEPAQKAGLEAVTGAITLPATVTTSSRGRPNILFSMSNTMNTELGASWRTKTWRERESDVRVQTISDLTSLLGVQRKEVFANQGRTRQMSSETSVV